MFEVPLADHEQFRTGDLDLIREVGGRVLVPHRVDALGRVSREARLNAAALGGVTLAYLRYESKIRLEAPTTDARYFFTLPLTGRADGIRGKSEAAESEPGLGLAYRADDRGVITLSPDYTMFFLRIERSALEYQCEGLLGREIIEPLRFDFSMDLRRPALRTWVNCVGLLRSELERDPAGEQEPLLRSRIEELVLMGLLVGQPHNYSELLHKGNESARPRTGAPCSSPRQDAAPDPRRRIRGLPGSSRAVRARSKATSAGHRRWCDQALPRSRSASVTPPFISSAVR